MKFWGILAAAVLFVALLVGAYFVGNRQGHLAERDKVTAAIAAQQKEEAEKLAALDELKKARDKEHARTTEVIRNAKGACLDQRIDPDTLRRRLLDD